MTMFEFDDILGMIEDEVKKSRANCARYCELNPDEASVRERERMRDIEISALHGFLHDFHRRYKDRIAQE